jgi:hypothetical protein
MAGMTRRILCLLALLVALPSLAQRSAAQPAAEANTDGNCTIKDASTRPECPQAIAFFDRLQKAVASGHRQQVAAMMHYPLRVRLNGKSAFLRAPRQLLANYDQVFDKGVQCTLAAATDRSVWGNANGFTFSSGALWWDAILPSAGTPSAGETNAPMKVITVNNRAPYPGCSAPE